ncbi:DUF1285 domain-containing protein [Psychrobium sp. MM17-31]|uniref:DUF1285 domain-containing protein n=1 Tax=Psychrobium sp. MM17-31 TaxID=2917758 RepID=UPI001EF4F58E|nr:DUF1285 domain-containing protein [Psychrobium sp. MM17-31]MCG7529858.1 DUF1285 domain-containing protein [Psychrobium sp. MM17-31]
MSFDLSKFTKDIGVETTATLSGEAYPLEKWSPQSCGAMDMQIKANGEWWHNGSEIKRDKLILLFSKVLCVEEGVHCLKTPVEKIEIEVEDAAFMVVDYQLDGDQLKLVTNIGDVVVVSKDYPLTLDDEKLYLGLWRGLKAKVNRNVYYDLVELALSQGGEEDNALWLTTEGERYCLGQLS